MALNILLDLQNTGLFTRYWRITQTHLDHAQGQVTVWLHGWRDAAARLEGRAAAGSLTLVLRAADLPGGTLHEATTSTIYKALKARAAVEAACVDQALEYAVGQLGHGVLADSADC